MEAYLAVLVGLCAVKVLAVNHDGAPGSQAPSQAPQVAQISLWRHIACTAPETERHRA